MYAYSEKGGSVTLNLTNNILSENSTFNGGGIYAIADSGGNVTLALKNNTITGNVASGDGGGIYAGTGVVIDIKNTISWGNKATGTGNDVCITDGTVRASYSNIGEVHINSGTYNDNEGNIDEDPLFANPDIGDYHLTPCSPCIDTGTNDVELSIDYEGDTRSFDGDGDNVETTDIGADEYTRPDATNVPPVADAGSVQSGIIGETMTFDGSASYDPDGTIESYDWDFGDGTTSSGIIVSHVYNDDGLYEVTLTITDDQKTWCSDTTHVEISGIDCTAYSLSPASKSFGSSGGSGSIGVTTTSGCSWNTSSNESWISITSGSSGTGNGTVSYSVLSNTGSTRTGAITIAGKTFTVTQDVGSIGPTPCPESISPVSESIGSSGGTDSVAVVASDSCDWTAASSDPSWLKITSGGSGTGDGTVNYTVSPNTGASSRTGTITITGDTSEIFKVNQAGVGTSPALDIMANSSDGPVTSGTSDTLSISIGVDANGSLGVECDLWLVVNTPTGEWEYFDSSLGDYTPGLSPTLQGFSLVDFGSTEIFNTSGLGAGTYTYYFGVDLNMNGTLDMGEGQLYYSSVVVNITP